MKIVATVTKLELVEGVEYDFDNEKAMQIVLAGNAIPVTVAPFYGREKAVPNQYKERR